MKMLTAILLFLLTFAFGPAMGSSFALAQGFSLLDTAVAVSLIHLLLVPIWFGIFKVIRYELLYRRKILEKLEERMKIRITKRIEAAVEENIKAFECGERRWFLGTGLFTLTFLMGVSWAALLASILNIRSRTIFPSVAAGALAASLFWTAALAGIMPFLPETWMIFLVTGVLTLALLTHGKTGEIVAIREMSKTLQGLGIRMEKSTSEKKNT